ncbi:hypothetical protein ASPNIDRAFT_37459 [Aspergillus niger ATCC 1015]|uniref:Uncharacterized protein n=1 Tax=Aspergillus niger (strain ATCC 1015 / CBS 113.46 / FGSC A1144 / LSHB Ac4 / NCTC 3858a / NRRL 328 / USDA 3528.7) TaxID=380704 RepID=G3Y248_ASPNA|nr:hypothetical protein ASPNIDRAFT_37459 [Aspergillus niger ATCC 1015]
MSHPITKFQPFPNFYVYRPGYMVVPLIPLDELPSWIQVGDFDWGNSSLYEAMLPASFNCFPRVGEYDVICHHCYKNVDSYHRSVSERSDSNASSRASDLPKGLAAQLPANSILLDPSFKLEQPPFGANLNSDHDTPHPPNNQTPQNNQTREDNQTQENDQDPPSHQDTPPPTNPPANSPPESPGHSDPSVQLEEGTPLDDLSHLGQGSKAKQASQATQAFPTNGTDQTDQEFVASLRDRAVQIGHAALSGQNRASDIAVSSTSGSVEEARSQTNGEDEAATSGDTGNNFLGRRRVPHRDEPNRRGRLFEGDVDPSLRIGLGTIASIMGGPSETPVSTTERMDLIEWVFK